MKEHSFYSDADGSFLPSLFSGPAALLELNTPAGHIALEGRFDHLSQRVDLATGEVIDYQPPAPADDAMQTWAWDAEAKRWKASPTLLAVQRSRKDAIDAERMRRTVAPIDYAGALFDADEVAMRNVAGWQTQIAAGVDLPPGFVWRDATNIDHPADAAFVNGLGAAITLRGTILYATAWALKAAIDAATTKEEAEAITWQD